VFRNSDRLKQAVGKNDKIGSIVVNFLAQMWVMDPELYEGFKSCPRYI